MFSTLRKSMANYRGPLYYCYDPTSKPEDAIYSISSYVGVSLKFYENPPVQVGMLFKTTITPFCTKTTTGWTSFFLTCDVGSRSTLPFILRVPYCRLRVMKALKIFVGTNVLELLLKSPSSQIQSYIIEKKWFRPNLRIKMNFNWKLLLWSSTLQYLYAVVN